MYLVQSSIACPEQYEIYSGSSSSSSSHKYLGYIRLRHGKLTLYDYKQEIVFSYLFNDSLKGSFDNEYEKYYFLFILLHSYNYANIYTNIRKNR